MLCVCIKGPSLEEARQQIEKALKYADLIELRLDCFDSLTALEQLRLQFSIPMIFTIRSQSQGGSYAKSEEARLAEIRRLALLKPTYLDLENDLSPQFIEEISLQHPDINIILSHHNHVEMPDDLDALYGSMKKIPAYYYKIAVAVNNSLDALRLLALAKKGEGKLIAIGMGSQGQVTRILGPVVGCPITYAALDETQPTGMGQLPAQLLIERYHHRALHAQTALYGLIGDPVDQSISDETHNHFIASSGLNAVYVKIRVRAGELTEFFPLAKSLGFRGLSVTMPLKESVMAYLDRIDPQAAAIGAVNTLVFEQGKIIGYNTDSSGALNAVERECPVKGKRLVIIGAGGAAKAVAYEACRRGAVATILNRDGDKAIQLARDFRCFGGGLEQMERCAQEGYDVLINCTPVPLPIAVETILPQAIVMDIKTRPQKTDFLKQAKSRGCKIIYGYRMFVEQALGQFTHWFRDLLAASDDDNRVLLEQRCVEVLSQRESS